MKMTTDLLKRYFSGKYSRKDYHLMHEQFSLQEDQQDLKESMEQHWVDFEIKDTVPETEFDNLLHKIHHQLHLDVTKKTIRLSNIQWLQRIAAILFVPLLLSFLAYVFVGGPAAKTDAYAEIQSPLSGKTHFVLPDGSSGYLNNGSTLKYPIAFKENRTVDLVGEAFFDVTHDGTPFHVLTKNLDVRVMGTSFNVSAWETDPSEEIILQTGKVRVSSKAGKQLAVLNPDQQLIFNLQSRKYKLENVDAKQFTAWTEGRLVFRNESMDDVVKRLSRWYNVDFEVSDPRLLHYTFHATFMDERLDEVLKLLSLTTPVLYEEEKRTQTGTEPMERRKIKLKLNQEKLELFQ